MEMNFLKVLLHSERKVWKISRHSFRVRSFRRNNPFQRESFPFFFLSFFLSFIEIIIVKSIRQFMHLHHSSFELKTFHSNTKYSLYITVCMSSVTFRENRDREKGCKFSPKNIFHISKSHFVWTRKRIDSSLTRSLEGCVWRKRSSVMMHMKGIWLLSVLSTFL